MQLGSIIFTVLATVATLIHAVPVPVVGGPDLDYCLKMCENLDSHMRPGEAELPDNLPTCTNYWYQAAADCSYKVDQETKIGTVPEEHKSCFEEMFLKHKTQGPTITRRQGSDLGFSIGGGIEFALDPSGEK